MSSTSEIASLERAIGSVVEVDDLLVRFMTNRGPVHAVNGVSLHVGAGEVVGIVGEAGSGKSTLALSLMRLLPEERCAIG